MKLFFAIVIAALLPMRAAAAAQTASGTLVVAVPVTEGLVACADKRLYNDQTGGFTDDFVKIKKVNHNTLFVATNTVGFLDKTAGKIEFDVFEITSAYVSQREFTPGRQYWDGLKNEIRKQLRDYLAKRNYNDWPETDRATNRLLFNLVFYSAANNTARSYSLRVFYEKARTPVIDTPDVVSEIVRTPKLSGKGRDVMAYVARNPSFASDPAILQFDQSRFDIKKTTVATVVGFAKKLFSLTSTAIPQARVSAAYDCALLSYQDGFLWLDDSGRPVN